MEFFEGIPEDFHTVDNPYCFGDEGEGIALRSKEVPRELLNQFMASLGQNPSDIGSCYRIQIDLDWTGTGLARVKLHKAAASISAE